MRFVFFVVIAAGSASSFLASAQVNPKIDFVRDVQPVLQEHCYECHGASQQMNGLRLDRRRDVIPNRVGANRAAVVAGDSSRSAVYLRVSGTKAGRQMPPAGPLSAEQIDTVKRWIDQGADWTLTSAASLHPVDRGVEDIAQSLRQGDYNAFATKLSASPALVNARGRLGWTPLMYAVLYGNVDNVSQLLKAGAEINAKNDDGGTALHYAVDSLEKTRLLLDHGADPNIKSGDSITPLLIAIRIAGSAPVAKELFDHGAAPQARLPDGRNALQLAASSDLELLKLLLARGVDPKPIRLTNRNDGRCQECFDLLLNATSESNRGFAFLSAMLAGDGAKIDKLLAAGLKPTPNLLEFATVAPAFPADTYRRFISLGANVNMGRKNSPSILELARRQRNAALVDSLLAAGVSEDRPAPAAPEYHPAASPRAAIERSLPLLQHADQVFFDKAGCVSCHNNSLTAMTTATLRRKGVAVNEQVAASQLAKIAAFLEENRERALEGAGIPGAIDTVSYILFGLAAEKYPPDMMTDAWARYVKDHQAADGAWRCITTRPPLESSDFEVTAASIRALQAFAWPSRKAEYDAAIAKGVAWLEQAQPVSIEDHAFRILGLVWGRGSRRTISGTAQALLAMQQMDGGWGQRKGDASDAYATGQALVALREAGIVTNATPAYRRGSKFLLSSQARDGSWYVQSRTLPLQPYFDSEFPYGPDQFISAAATNWATLALSYSLP